MSRGLGTTQRAIIAILGADHRDGDPEGFLPWSASWRLAERIYGSPATPAAIEATRRAARGLEALGLVTVTNWKGPRTLVHVRLTPKGDAVARADREPPAPILIGMSARQRAAHLGVSLSTIKRWDRGR